MMKLYKYILLTVAAAPIFISCGSDGSDKSKAGRRELPIGETYVDTIHLKKSPFDNQTVCNGRLQALSKSTLTFPKAGYISSINVKEGQRVTKGALIATIDNTQQLREVERARHELERSQVTLVDRLIGLGYDVNMSNVFSSNIVPADLMKRTEVTSGYYSAKYALQTAETALAECELRAPFSGRIANVEAKLHQTSSNVCTLIDDSRFDVELKVLEAELKNVSVGQEVTVTPFIDDSLVCKGQIHEINPMVDDKGLVKVVARIAGARPELIDGMNMRVLINQRVEQMFVVPKDAVVERDGYHVIFLLREGRAVWTYVDVMHSNISSFAITGCKRKETTINEGDVVITSGNLNLADGTEVKVNRR